MIISNVEIYTKNKIIKNGSIIFNEKIIDILDYPIKDENAIDGSNLILIPGFIDSHTHGLSNYDYMDNNIPTKLEFISKTLPYEGVTSYFPTTMTSDLETLTTSLNVLSNEIKNHKVGSTPIGIHLEGPFISQVYKGAQGESFIQVPSIDTFIKLNKASNNLIKKVTLAPECDPNMELIKYLSKHNIVSSIGHSNATYDICKIAIENGVKSFTHGYNAMSKLHHRDIGCVGEMLLDDNVYVELICDLLHVSEPAIQLLYKCKKDKIILVTDSMRAKNQGDCISELGGQEVIVKDGKATLKDNTLAGSVLKADVAFRNYIKTTNCSIRQAIKATSTNVVKLHNLKNKGFIEKGYDSDFILMDKDLNIVNTFCLGVKY